MNNLKKLRERNGLSQANLAEKIGLSQQMVSYIETGLRDVTTGTLLLICEVLNCTPNEILGYERIGQLQQEI